ncbi:MAG: hypothetical protein Kilf2KO_42010 [Rhodospirillales bacterium]
MPKEATSTQPFLCLCVDLRAYETAHAWRVIQLIKWIFHAYEARFLASAVCVIVRWPGTSTFQEALIPRITSWIGDMSQLWTQKQRLPVGPIQAELFPGTRTLTGATNRGHLVFEKETGEMAKRKRQAAAFKEKVALEAPRDERTVAELAARLRGAPDADPPVEESASGASVWGFRARQRTGGPRGGRRDGRGSAGQRPAGETAETLTLMALIDRQFMETPFFGMCLMTWHLGSEGHAENPTRVRRPMRLMGPPEIMNRDQESQFTAFALTDRLRRSGIGISMDGKGRVLGKICIERPWRSLKYVCV